MQPKPGEVIQDPAAGTGGFLVAADQAIKDATDDFFDLSPEQTAFQRRTPASAPSWCPTPTALPDEPDAARHRGPVRCRHPLRRWAPSLRRADLILTNPPFGTKKGGGRPTRADFSFTAGTSNKQLAFLEHISAGSSPAAAPRSSCPTTSCSRTHGPDDCAPAHGQVRPPHHPAPAHRHLLRPGRQDQRPLLHPRRIRQVQHPRRPGSTTSGPTCQLRQDERPC
jgi:hypothetical protein